jgi:endonuclease/exonuclease/phosphatase family metal-dependent hydrolase
MSQTLHLCTWNIQLGKQLGTVLQVLEHNADFHTLDLLALQEASIHDTREDAGVMADMLGATYDCYQVTAHLLAGHAQANALVWNGVRVQVENKDSLKLPRPHEVKLTRREYALLRALPTQQRISLVVDARFNTETMRIYVAHLDVVGFEHKRKQLSRILHDAGRRSPVDLTLIVGDLNTFKVRSRPSWHNLIAAAEEAGFHDITSEISWTHAVHWLSMKQKLDAVFVRCARPLRYRSWALDAHGSDHIPVFSEITLE